MTTPKPLAECVPNFSEGRDMKVIASIVDAIGGIDGVSVLHVDAGHAANRTVVTFAGQPEAVAEAAFQGAKKAAELIDMRCHHGTHPRQGATDVLPIIPISGITLEQCATLARQVAARLASEEGIPCYAYEAAALKTEHVNLADCRAGEYEALHQKLTDPVRRPDFMPRNLDRVEQTGISVVGARQFLIAVNFNLDTDSTAVAKAIAADIRQKGRPGRPFAMNCVKAIGWMIEEYGIAQVSVNLTDMNVTPLHQLYVNVSRCAIEHGARVTGTEIIGMVPKRALTLAGRFFLEHQQLPADADEHELIAVAVSKMGLDDLRPFPPEQKVIEYALGLNT